MCGGAEVDHSSEYQILMFEYILEVDEGERGGRGSSATPTCKRSLSRSYSEDNLHLEDQMLLR